MFEDSREPLTDDDQWAAVVEENRTFSFWTNLLGWWYGL